MASTTESKDDLNQLQPWQFFTLAGLTGATVLVFLQVFVWKEGRPEAILLSLTVGAAAAAGYTAYRVVLPLFSHTEVGVPEVVEGRTRAGIEREKNLVLRSIKDLEFDRSMGKVTERDFAEVSVRLRARAARLLRQLDNRSSYRDQIERELAGRLGAVSAPAARACATCHTPNDIDARFCKGCGAKLEAA